MEALCQQLREGSGRPGGMGKKSKWSWAGAQKSPGEYGRRQRGFDCASL